MQGYCYVCHPTLDQILKQNKKSKANGKAVGIGYFISFVIMASCGVLGAMALYKK